MNTTLTDPSATTVAIDLAKDVFELAYVDADGRIVARQRLGAVRSPRCSTTAHRCAL